MYVVLTCERLETGPFWEQSDYQKSHESYLHRSVCCARCLRHAASRKQLSAVIPASALQIVAKHMQNRKQHSCLDFFLSPRFCYRGNCCFSTNAARPRVCSDTARLFNWSIEALIRPCIWYQNYFGVWVPGPWWFMILARVSWNQSETATIVRISSENTYYSNDIIWTYCCHWWKIHYLLPLWLIFSLWRLRLNEKYS